MEHINKKGYPNNGDTITISIYFFRFSNWCVLSGCELHVDIVCGWSVIPARTTGMRSNNDSMKRASSSVNVSVWLFVVIAWGE